VLTLDGGPALSDRDLGAIVRLVYENSGITLHDGKRALVMARLQKRLRAGGFRSFRAYLEHVQADRSGEELTLLLDAIATNHTSFFREPQHFSFLRSRVLPELGDRRAPRIWSAACSTGEEPYTLAMVLADALGPQAANARLLASDISTKALAVARAGVYRRERVAELPLEVLRRHFERGLGEQEGLVRVAPALGRAVEFRRLNLLEVGSLGEVFDAVFCRNVMIYFDKAVQQRVVESLEQHVAPGGYLFIAHSESLNGIDHGLTWIAPAVYQRGYA
jgi:chemotaxis protein methyltransferase CheR